MTSLRKQVRLMGTVYNYKVTESYIWLEDHETKRQWVCSISKEPPPVGIPMQVALAHIERVFEHGGSTQGLSTLNLRHNRDNLTLGLSTTIQSAGVSWSARHDFSLEIVRLSDGDLVNARLAQLREDITALRASLHDQNVRLKQLETNWVAQAELLTTACARMLLHKLMVAWSKIGDRAVFAIMVIGHMSYNLFKSFKNATFQTLNARVDQF